MILLTLPLLWLACFWLMEHATVPWAWIALLAVAYCLWGFRRTRATIGKILWLNVGVAIAVLGLAEVYLWRVSPPVAIFDPAFLPTHGYVSHDDYGYGPATPSRTRSVKLEGGEPIYDVVYTIDSYGVRVSPPELDAAHRRGCVLFFGCSNTFGEGVQDDETMPWQIGVKTAGRFATRNLGFSGWGPHQMLAALQAGHAARAVRCDVTHIVYLALYWHASRVAGRAFWDRDGPRYVLDDAGRAIRVGHFSDVKTPGLPRPLLDRLRRSFLYKKYLVTRLDPFDYPIEPVELDLLAAVVERAREEAAVRFPHASLHVLFWDIGLDPKVVSEVTTRLTRPGITLHPLSRAIPDYRSWLDLRYTLSLGDRHPTPAAYALIADYVVKEILHDSEH